VAGFLRWRAVHLHGFPVRCFCLCALSQDFSYVVLNKTLHFFAPRAPRCSLRWPPPLLPPSAGSVRHVRGPGCPLSIRRATTVGGGMSFEDSVLASPSLPLTHPPLRHSLLLRLLHCPAPQPGESSALAVPVLGIPCSIRPAILAVQRAGEIILLLHLLCPRRRPRALPTFPHGKYSAPAVRGLGILCSIRPAILAAQKVVKVARIVYWRLPPLAPLSSCICSAPDVPDLGIL
jgi:hypothetical protein